MLSTGRHDAYTTVGTKARCADGGSLQGKVTAGWITEGGFGRDGDGQERMGDGQSLNGVGAWVLGLSGVLCEGGLGVAHPDRRLWRLTLIQVAKMQGCRKPAIRHSRARLKGCRNGNLPVGRFPRGGQVDRSCPGSGLIDPPLQIPISAGAPSDSLSPSGPPVNPKPQDLTPLGSSSSGNPQPAALRRKRLGRQPSRFIHGSDCPRVAAHNS